MTILRTQNLDITIGGRHLIKGVNATFSSGQIWGILGPNGSGKTTLLHTLAGLKKIRQGKVFLNGIELNQISCRKRAQSLGLLLQDFESFFPTSVLTTALSGRYPYQQHWFKECKEDRCLARQALFDMELDELSLRNVASLSGGEKQRLMLSALLTQNPGVYLLDEPTNHLDLRQRIRVLSLFKRLAEQQKIVVMVLHEMDLIRTFCDHVIILNGNGEYNLGLCEEILNKEIFSQLFPEGLMKSYADYLIEKTFKG